MKPSHLVFLLLIASLLGTGCLKTVKPAAMGDEGELLPSTAGAGEALLPSSQPDPAAEPGPETAEKSEEALLPPVGEAVVSPTPVPEVEAKPGEAAAQGAGRVLRVNEKLGYVLIEGAGRFATGQDAIVFRDGQAVGRVKISAPRQRPYYSADIEEGDLQVGDVVK
jgi:hypothetical protein